MIDIVFNSPPDTPPLWVLSYLPKDICTKSVCTRPFFGNEAAPGLHRLRKHTSAHPMAHLDSAHPRVSLPKQLTNFTNSSAGLDLTLRLIQALAQIAAEVCIDNATFMRYVTAKSQLALGKLIAIPCSDGSSVIRVHRSISGD